MSRSLRSCSAAPIAKKEGKGEGNTDIFVDVVDAGLQVALESNLPGTLVTPSTAKVTFKVGMPQKNQTSRSASTAR